MTDPLKKLKFYEDGINQARLFWVHPKDLHDVEELTGIVSLQNHSSNKFKFALLVRERLLLLWLFLCISFYRGHWYKGPLGEGGMR